MLNNFSRLLILLLLLYSCSYFEDEKEVELPGKRENVFEIEKRTLLKANKKINLDSPKSIKSWPQQHQNLRNHLFHLKSSDSISLKKKIELGDITFGKFKHIVEPVIKSKVIFFVNDDFTLNAMDMKNESIVWSVQLKEEKEESLSFIGGLALSDYSIIVTTGLGNIYSINLKNGKIIWKKKFIGQFSRPPSIKKNKIFTVSDDNQLLCLEINSGDVLWTHTGSIEEVSIIGGSKPAIGNDIIVVSYSSGEIFALKINNGEVLWFDDINSNNFFNRNIINDIQSPVTILDKRVYVPTFSDNFIVYNITNGKKLWNLKFSSLNPFVISGDVIYTIDISGRLLCLEKEAGKLLWAVQLQQTNDGEEVVWRGPLLSSNKLIVVSSTGSVISLSPFSGHVLSKIKYSEEFVLSPIQVGNEIFLTTSKGDLMIFK